MKRKDLTLLFLLPCGALGLLPACRGGQGVRAQASPAAVQLGARLLCTTRTRARRQYLTRLAAQPELGFLNPSRDTLFLMEAVSPDNLRPVGRIWNATGAAAFGYDAQRQTFDFSFRPFHPHHIRLVHRFDSVALRAEAGPVPPVGSRQVRATRMVFNGASQQCQSFRFAEVVDFQRDK